MSELEPTPSEGAPKGRALKIAAIVVALLVVISGVAFFVARGQGGNNTAATPAPSSASAPAATSPASPSAQPTPAGSSPAAVPPAATTPTAASCTTAEGHITDPKRFKVESRDIDSRMITVGKDADGNPGAPPPAESQTTAWYNASPEVGSDKGNTILTIHTYSPKNGANALGNKLYSDAGLKVGDIIKISDGSGKQVCYRYTGNTKVWVKSYDPASGVFHNLTGPPQLAIMVCWDYNKNTNDWDSRIIFYAALMPVGQD